MVGGKADPRTHGRIAGHGRGRVRVPVAVLLSAMAACVSRDPQTPEGAFTLLVDALAQRSCPRLYDRLDARTKQEIAALYGAARTTYDVLMAQYPTSERQRELARLDILAHVREANDPQSFFMSFCGAEFPLGKVGARELAGARPRSVEYQGEQKAIVTSRAGDRFVFVRGSDGVWATEWLREDYRRVAEAAQRNLGIVRERARSFTGGR